MQNLCNNIGLTARWTGFVNEPDEGPMNARLGGTLSGLAHLGVVLGSTYHLERPQTL
jgi:hypothetical protein